MQRTSIYLDDGQVRALEVLAAEGKQSMADLVHEAVDDYLARKLTDQNLFSERLDSLLTRVRSRIPADATPEEIETDIGLARDEVRQRRRAARRR